MCHAGSLRPRRTPGLNEFIAACGADAGVSKRAHGHVALGPYTGRMRMTLVDPCKALAPYVRRFSVIEAQEETTRVLIPEPGVVLGFRYAGQARLVEAQGMTALPDFVITGLRPSARRMCTSAGGGIVVAMLRETGAAAFFDAPLHELFGASLALDTLVRGSELELVAQQLAGASAVRGRVAVVERFLLARLRPRSPDRLVRAAVDALHGSGGSLRVSALARELGIGVDRLEKRFRQTVGASPKQLGSLYRLLRAMELHRSGLSLSQIALQAGYADQSHFIRGFRAAIGEAPKRFLESNEYCGSIENARDEWLRVRLGAVDDALFANR
jgi:AraC-like DNA-binding protein